MNRTEKGRLGAADQRGVTLIELLIVITVLSILASIAVSSYRRYLVRANRTDGTMTLLRIQVAQEKYFLQNRTYADSTATAITDAPPAGLGVTLRTGNITPNGFYTISVTTSNSGSHYVATATATGTQTSDLSACLTFTIDQSGARTPDPSTGCWR